MARLFTLVELMIVVAIIALLAAIAIPQFYSFQIRTRLAEVPLNGHGIRDALVSYHAAHDDYLTAAYNPVTPPQKTRRPWFPVTDSNWDALGWSPDGDVYAAYTMTPPGGGCPGSNRAIALVDLDEANGVNSLQCCVEPDDQGYTFESDGICAFRFNTVDTY